MSAGYRWVSCAQDSDWATSRYRHILRRGYDTTLCGATGLGAGVWRGCNTKANCPECVSRASTRVEDQAQIELGLRTPWDATTSDWDSTAPLSAPIEVHCDTCGLAVRWAPLTEVYVHDFTNSSPDLEFRYHPAKPVWDRL